MERIQKTSDCAPMPRNKEVIVDNPMKLYTYLVCIGGLAEYPENARMFRHKDLSFTKIQRATGITNDTVKLYMFYLEQRGLIKYKGGHKFDTFGIAKRGYENIKDYRAAAIKNAKEVWKKRNTEKTSVYIIPRPTPWTPIPEITLEKLNKDFEVSELELKIYLICCSIRDLCVRENQSYKTLTLEDFRDFLGVALHQDIDAKIRHALYFYKGIGLLEFEECYYSNSRGAKIPVFKISEVYYYIDNRAEILDQDLKDFTEEQKEEVRLRIRKGFKEEEIG